MPWGFAGVVVNTIPDFIACNLSPCSYEKVDTRIFVHAVGGVQQGKKRLKIRTVDSDVVILAIHFVL